MEHLGNITRKFSASTAIATNHLLLDLRKQKHNGRITKEEFNRRGKEEVNKAANSLKNWEEPSFLEYDLCKAINAPANTNKGTQWAKHCKNTHSRTISARNQMINFKRRNKNPSNNGLLPNYESRKKRYWQEKNYNVEKKSVKNVNGSLIRVNKNTIHRYTAKAPALRGFSEKRYTNSNNINKAKIMIQKGADSIDIENYQKQLSDPTTRDQAKNELQIFKQMIIDARTMTRADLDAKYKNIRSVQTIASSLGMIFGFAAGSGAVSSVSQSLSTAATVTSVGLFSKKYTLKELGTLVSPSLNVAGKIAAAAVVGTAIGLSGAGFPLTVIALVSTAAALGAEGAARFINAKKIRSDVNSFTIVNLIDEIIKNEGVILEDNPMFANARRVKETINRAIQFGKNVNTVINTMPNSNKKIARTLLEQMKEANVELQKQAATTMFNKRALG